MYYQSSDNDETELMRRGSAVTIDSGEYNPAYLHPTYSAGSVNSDESANSETSFTETGLPSVASSEERPPTDSLYHQLGDQVHHTYKF